MLNVFLGKKMGMTQVFRPDGLVLPVTVIELLPGYISHIKIEEKDGYSAASLAFGLKKRSLVKKSEIGQSIKLGAAVPQYSFEVKISTEDLLSAGLSVGSELSSGFIDGDIVDVSSVSKGKGFAGVVKRWGFACQDATHGNSLSHRAPGSIGQRQSPGRVFKGKKMSGHLGASRCTIKNLEVARFIADRGLLLIKGGVPGHVGTPVLIKRSR